MKKFLLILGLVLSQAGAVRAQLAPANEAGMSWGHLHLYAQDREKEAKAWMALGGRLGMNLSGNIPITFPGILILINFAPASQGGVPTGGSAGSVVDHVAFRVPDLQATLATLRGPVVAGKDLSWGLKIEPGTKPGQSFVTTPSLVKIEILEDKSLKLPIVFDHAHFFVPETALPAIEAYYQKMFGAKPVKGEADTCLSLPGGKLVFSKSITPTVPTLGRSARTHWLHRLCRSRKSCRRSRKAWKQREPSSTALIETPRWGIRKSSMVLEP